MVAYNDRRDNTLSSVYLMLRQRICSLTPSYRLRFPNVMFLSSGQHPLALCGLHNKHPARADFGFFRLWFTKLHSLQWSWAGSHCIKFWNDGRLPMVKAEPIWNCRRYRVWALRFDMLRCQFERAGPGIGGIPLQISRRFGPLVAH